MFQAAKPRAFLIAAVLTSLQLLAAVFLGPPWDMGLLAPGSLFALFAFAPVGFAGFGGYFGAGAADLVFRYWILYICWIGAGRGTSNPAGETFPLLHLRPTISTAARRGRRTLHS